MRAFSLVVILAVLGSGLSCLRASEGFEELANRAKAGATEEALGAFVQKSNVAYDLTVDEIFVLSDLGYSSKTIAAIVDHGKLVKSGKMPVTTEASLPPTTNDAATTTQPALTALQVDSTTTTQSATTNTAAQGNPAGDATTAATQQTDATQIQSADQNGAATNDPNATQIDALAIANADPNATTLTTTTGETLHVDETVNASFNPGNGGEAVAPAEGDENVSMFYESLAPYGEWVKLDGAWYWRPQACVTDPNWRPYCDRGHWTWTDSDWCWQSDYSWGWAPFHYGRWAECEGYGWLWMPDTCWSPAWVSWRECDSAYGWAPLPWSARYDAGLGFRFGGKHWGVDFGFGLGYRDYCFCPREHFCDLSLRINVYGRHENNRFFGQSHVLQNNVSYTNNRVIVNGPRFDHVQNAYHEPIKQLHIADANIKAGEKLSHANREDRRNGTIALYRPQVKEGSKVTPASFVSKRITTTNSINATNRAVSGVKYSSNTVRTGEQGMGAKGVQLNHNGTQFNNASTQNHTVTPFNNTSSINHNNVVNNPTGHATTGEHVLNTTPNQSNGTQPAKTYESTGRQNFSQPINQNNVMTSKTYESTSGRQSTYQPTYQNSSSSSSGSFRGTTSNGGNSGNYSGGSYNNGGNYNNNNSSSNGHRGR